MSAGSIVRKLGASIYPSTSFKILMTASVVVDLMRLRLLVLLCLGTIDNKGIPEFMEDWTEHFVIQNGYPYYQILMLSIKVVLPVITPLSCCI
jgi:hypothetical protein